MKRIIIDSTLCDGCRECEEVCKAHFADGGTRVQIRLDDHGRFVPLICRQCPRPSCLHGCMSGAISRNYDTGYLHYDKNKCGSCYMCVMNCPYGIPYPTSDGYVARCDFCGGSPQCVSVCKKEAIYLKEE